MKCSATKRLQISGVVLAIVLAMTVIPAVVTSAATTDYDSYNGVLAIVRGEKGSQSLWTVRPDGTSLVRLVNDFGTIKDVSWSPEGTKLAFSSNRSGKPQVYVVNADGTGAVDISGGTWGDRNPAWSPTGNLIAFNRGYADDDGLYELWVMDPTGANQRPLVQDNSSPNTSGGVPYGSEVGTTQQPSWNPNGSSVVFAGQDSTNTNNCCDLFEVDVSGGTLRQITTGSNAFEPSYAPDGSHIIYSADGDVRAINPDGSNDRLLAGNDYFTSPSGCVPDWQGYDYECDSDLQYSPDGRFLASVINDNVTIFNLPQRQGKRLVDGSSVAWKATPIHRIAGTNRTWTAVAASKDQFESGAAGAVVLVRSDNYADALAGTALAVRKNAPLLLTNRYHLDDNTSAELRRVLPSGRNVYLLGGTSALSADISTQLKNLGYQPRRLAGETRFATAVAIAKELGSPNKVFLATGLSHGDGLAAGVSAAHVGGVVILTADRSIPEATQSYLNSLASPTIYAVGKAQGSYAGAEGLGSTTSSPDTAAALARRFFTSPSRVAIATSLTFPDALSGGAHAGHQGRAPAARCFRSTSGGELHPQRRCTGRIHVRRHGCHLSRC